MRRYTSTDEILTADRFSMDDDDIWVATCPHCKQVRGLDGSESPRGEQFMCNLCGGSFEVSHDAKRVKDLSHD